LYSIGFAEYSVYNYVETWCRGAEEVLAALLHQVPVDRPDHRQQAASYFALSTKFVCTVISHFTL
jgi:hypothetical protein